MASQARRRWLLAGLVLGVVAAAALGALWAVRLSLDSYRERIERLVAQSTGRPFHLQGPLRLRLAPLAIETGPAQLGNLPGMAGPPLAACRSMRAVLELLPLLHRRLILDDIHLDGLEVHLQRTKDGRTNWSGLFAGGAQSPQLRGGNSLPIELHALEIRGGEVELADAGSARRVQLSGVSLDVGPARWDSRFEIGSVRLTGQVQSPQLRGALPVRVDLTDLRASRAPYQLALSHAALRFGGVLAEGSLAAADFDDGGWQARGALSAQVASVRDLAEMLGVPVPGTRDPQSFGALTLTSGWTFAGGTVTFDALRAHLDETSIAGRILYRPTADKALLELELHGDRVDLDRYATSKTAGSSGSTLAQLRALPVEGTLSFDDARLSGTELHHVRLEMGALKPAGLQSGRPEGRRP